MKYSQYSRQSLAVVGRAADRISYLLPKETPRLPELPTLSREAGLRLKVLEYARTHTVAATCRHFNIARSTYYRWKHRFNPHNLLSLESRSSRPKRVRRRSWSLEQIQAVHRLREQYPRWGKQKLWMLLRREGIRISVSMIGRILLYLRERGVLREPRVVRVRHSRHKRPYATRKPKGYQAVNPGELVQIDTVDLRPIPGVIRKQFTAIDIVSRWSVLGVRATASAGTAREFLEQVRERMPFEVKAIQVDGGSEFMAEFESACQQRGIRLFVLPPRSPKLNGSVERCNRTSRNEFWECYAGDLELETCQQSLLEYERVYNEVRPHQALGYLTPSQFLAQL